MVYTSTKTLVYFIGRRESRVHRHAQFPLTAPWCPAGVTGAGAHLQAGRSHAQVTTDSLAPSSLGPCVHLWLIRGLHSKGRPGQLGKPLLGVTGMDPTAAPWLSWHSQAFLLRVGLALGWEDMRWIRERIQFFVFLFRDRVEKPARSDSAIIRPAQWRTPSA